MQHWGDITKIDGFKVPIVDVVSFGAPCQDLSVAGKRAGMRHESLGDEEATRSGLFMEAIRIIKEMREHDRRNGANVNIRPRYAIYENVPGAFSSNKAEDFRIVLEETAKVCDKDAVIPMPNNGKWTTSGCILGNGWSIAWRVCDAQFYGVPQRRRRIALIADFGGHSAPEILFVRKSVSRDTESSQPKGKETPTDASRGIGTDDIFCIDGDKLNKKERKGGSGIGYRDGDKQYTLTAKDVHGVAYSIENHPADSRVDIDESGKVQTLTSRMGTGGGNVPMVMECYSKSKRAQSDTDYETWKESDVANTLNAFDVGDKRTTECVVALDRASFNQGKNALYDFEVSEKGINSPLVAKGPSAVAYVDTSDGDIAGTLDASYYKGCGVRQGRERTFGAVAAVDCPNCTENSDINGTLQSHMAGGSSLNLNNVVRVKYIVRRLTPLECERLQGYPDGWTDIGDWTDSKGKVHKTSDAARYKALGNSIALPPWKWVLKRLCACYERDATLASLFDGLGGFPYLWEQINGKGSCLWASEIEDFPIAVTKARIGEKEKI
jgi:DNA (cytosine-5)-methyltransferase 1